ncbi:MAG: glycosyltransferase family 2 protein [Sphingobacteriales bacterium]|nr:MAG: glycosyltransferase family 2 protein [Sphingobacteriales bacterium]TAF82681.1 MAG: glycosyltransferase family 2 protein [Sphingobacteriales bacterium]
MGLKTISVIIPNYNGKHLLEQNLPSVYVALKNIALDFEIILVDDCSKDNSVTFIKEKYQDIKVIVNDKNKGFSATCNKGIFEATKELIFLLNTDIQLTPNYFDGQLKYFDDKNTFGVMGKIIGFKDKEVQDTARYITRNGLKIQANNFYHINNPDFWTPTAYLSGANALIDAKKLKEIGGFDELFSPFYCEDFELGLRSWRLGWSSYYHAQSVCLHEQSSTTKNIKTKNWVKAVFFRNRMFAHAIHLPPLALNLWFVQVLLTDFLFSWLFLKLYFYKSFFMFFKNLGAIKLSRLKMTTLMCKYNNTISVNDVNLKMDALLKGQNVILGKGK